MEIANKPLNSQALVLEETETKIRELVQNEYFKQTPKSEINLKARQLIQSAINQIKIPSLKAQSLVSLLNFFEKQYTEVKKITPLQVGFVVALGKLQDQDLQGAKSPLLPPNPTKPQARTFLQNHGVKPANLYGSPLQKFSKDYIEKNIKPTMERLAKQFPLDPSDVKGRMSLRGKAELEVRYQHNQDMIQDLKDKGNKLVICSTHADCSDRCAKWQGRVFSLDGTSGTTDDGRKFVPLEVATNQEQVYHVNSKTGTKYKGGLLGYNCRHYLVPYKSGYKFPKPNVKEERKQYEITVKQRQLEREVIKWKTEAVTFKKTDKERYEFARKKAEEWNKRYIEFSKTNNRTYYPSRTKII